MYGDDCGCNCDRVRDKHAFAYPESGVRTGRRRPSPGTDDSDDEDTAGSEEPDDPDAAVNMGGERQRRRFRDRIRFAWSEESLCPRPRRRRAVREPEKPTESNLVLAPQPSSASASKTPPLRLSRFSSRNSSVVCDEKSAPLPLFSPRASPSSRLAVSIPLFQTPGTSLPPCCGPVVPREQ